MFRRPVDSSLIRAVGYDLASSVLEVEFAAGGRLYQYLDVPLSIYSELMAAESLGSFFNDHIRDIYVYQEITEGRHPAAMDAGQILQFILDRIARIGRRPLMFGGNAEGVDLILNNDFELWAEIVGRREEYQSAMEAEFADSASFATRCRESRPEAGEDEVAGHVVRRWMAIAERCGLDIPPITNEAPRDRSLPDRETP